MIAVADRPLLVTLDLDEATAARFEAERRALMPPAQNRVPAHCMLFHDLPQAEIAEVRDALRAAAERPRLALRIDEVRPLGRGVAYAVTGAELLAVHDALAQRFAARLVAQDRERYRPHVVVQNKVTNDVARATLDDLRRTFAPFDARGTALHLYRYDGGPWTSLARYAFRAEE